MPDSENQRLLFEHLLSEVNRAADICLETSQQIADMRVALATLEGKVENLQKSVSELKAQDKNLATERTKGKWALISGVVTGLLALLGLALKELLTK